MRKTLSIIILTASISFWTQVFWYNDHNLQSANFLWKKSIIVDNSGNVTKYNLDFSITRREMLKIMMNTSGRTVNDSCSGKFSDMWASDWGCKYAEAALKEWFISQNVSFRPNDNVTQIEALKMVMQAKWLKRDATDDWRAWYVSKAKKENLINGDYLEYNDNALRGWIFSVAANSYTDFSYTAPEYELDKEIEELFDSLLNL